MTGVTYEEITDKGLVITTKDGSKETIEADTIIPTSIFKPNTELLESIKKKVPEVYAIGDSNKYGLIKNAISDGYHTARAM